MSKPIVRRLIVVLALSALLGSPATSLAGSSRSSVRHSGYQTAARSPLSWLWNTLVSGWEKAGCHVDPYGRCLTSSQKSVDNGCGLKPYGQCLTGTQETADAGCLIDPNGRCIPGQ